MTPVYTVCCSGDTWASIAQLLYGTTAVASQLEESLGSPVLSPGEQLSYLPSSLSYSATTVAVQPSYIVQAGDTWARYHAGSLRNLGCECGGGSAGGVGQPLSLYRAAAQLCAVRPGLRDHCRYHGVTAVPSHRHSQCCVGLHGACRGYLEHHRTSSLWQQQSGCGGSAAGGTRNLTLSAGAKLTNLPLSLTYTNSARNRPTSYIVQPGDTWQSITQTPLQ